MIAAIYARKSTPQKTDDEEAKSVPRQIANAKAFAAKQGWTVDDAHVYADDKISGAHTAKLLDRQRLLDLIATGHPPFDKLIVRDESRFSRRDGDIAFGELKDIAKQGVSIWFYGTGEQFKYGDLGSNVGGFIKSEMAAEYRRQVSRWVTEAMHRKAERGHVAGNSTYGYTNVRLDDKHVERQIKPDEAKVVARIFDMVAVQGMGATRIAKQLNADRVPSPNPGKAKSVGWSPSSVRNILERSTYRGVVTYNTTGKQDIGGGRFKTVKRPKSDWIVRTLPHLRIVSDDTWKAAHDRMAVNRKVVHAPADAIQRRDYESKYLLVGFSRCECGAGYHARQAYGNTHRYACSSHFRKGTCAHASQWNIDDVNRSVMTEIRKAFDGFPVDRLLARARTIHAARTSTDRTKQLRQDVAKVDREIARLTDAIVAGAGAVQAVVNRLQDANAKRLTLLADLEDCGRTTSATKSWADVERIIRKNVATVHDWFTGGPVTEQRDLLRRILKTPIQFRPTIHNDGHRDLHFSGQLGLSTVLFHGVVTNDHSLSDMVARYMPSFSGVLRGKRAA